MFAWKSDFSSWKTTASVRQNRRIERTPAPVHVAGDFDVLSIVSPGAYRQVFLVSGLIFDAGALKQAYVARRLSVIRSFASALARPMWSSWARPGDWM